MKQYLSLIKKTKMFMGINENEIEEMFNCLSARIVHYKKNEYVLRSGEPVRVIGMVLSGLALVEREDYWGNRSILSEVTPGMIFAESYACLLEVPVETSVISSEKTVIMFFDISKLLTVCSSACKFHSRLIQNLLGTIARKNVDLTKKIDYISKKTIREKLLSYLSSESIKNGTPSFEIPFNRQQLADYLSVDRSALSNEISKLKSEGLLLCKKNRFELKDENANNL